jgi:hypothetical protein
VDQHEVVQVAVVRWTVVVT